MSFTELGPQLLKLPNVDYLLSEVFSQDPLERYFSRQRHRGGNNDNLTAEQVPRSGMTLIQQQAIYRDLKTMNVEQDISNLSASQPLKKRPRITRQWNGVYIVHIMHNHITVIIIITRENYIIQCPNYVLSLTFGFRDFLVPFLYLLSNYIVHPLANAWPRIDTHRLITAFRSAMLYTSNAGGMLWAIVSQQHKRVFVFMASSVICKWMLVPWLYVCILLCWGGGEQWPLSLPLGKEPSAKE